VLSLIARLKDQGVIRRFGATLRHQKAGYGHNAMVAWRVDDEAEALRVGEIMAARPEISHCYIRRTYPQWRYNLYTMIHGKNPGDCSRVVQEIALATGVSDHQTLASLRELKKTSMRYF
jgi:DNA-binding Lrp family transcriptional regulator